MFVGPVLIQNPIRIASGACSDKVGKKWRPRVYRADEFYASGAVGPQVPLNEIVSEPFELRWVVVDSTFVCPTDDESAHRFRHETFTPPEQVDGAAEAVSDWYAFAGCVYFAVFGVPPPAGGPDALGSEELFRHVSAHPSYNFFSFLTAAFDLNPARREIHRDLLEATSSVRAHDYRSIARAPEDRAIVCAMGKTDSLLVPTAVARQACDLLGWASQSEALG